MEKADLPKEEKRREEKEQKMKTSNGNTRQRNKTNEPMPGTPNKRFLDL
jgi:hypothetical protein